MNPNIEGGKSNEAAAFAKQEWIRRMRAQMTGSAPNPELALAVCTREISGTQLTAQVSPCSWMYKGYPFQITVSMRDGGDVTVKSNDKTYATASVQDIQSMLDQVAITACSRCGKPAFDPTRCRTNRGGLCESCFMGDLNAVFAKHQASEAANQKKLDAKYKAQGFTHRLVAWVHPLTGGDDYSVQRYWKTRPADHQVQKILKKAHSAVLNDYCVVEL